MPKINSEPTRANGRFARGDSKKTLSIQYSISQTETDVRIARLVHFLPINMLHSRTDPTNDIAAFLEANTEPGSIIGMTGGGNAGYFIQDRTVINMDGLINSYEYFQLLKDKQAGELLANEGLDYILANSSLLNQLPYKGQFASYLEWMDIRYGGKDLVRYHAP